MGVGAVTQNIHLANSVVRAESALFVADCVTPTHDLPTLSPRLFVPSPPCTTRRSLGTDDCNISQ
jgi:hypothetical protein